MLLLRFCLLSYFLLLSFYSYSSDPYTIKIDEGKLQQLDTNELWSDHLYIDFNLPDSLEKYPLYWYRVFNYDEYWHSTEYPQFRYSGLPGGEYIFQVSVDSLQLNTIFEFPFLVKKAFWETWWFTPFVILSLLGIGALIAYFWYLYDYRQQMKSNLMRQRIAADLHDEVGSNLSSMAFSAELIKKKLENESKELHPMLDNLLANSRETSSLISDTIWALNPKHDPFDKLVEKMKAFTQDILSSKEIEYKFEVTGNGPIPSISIEQKRNLYLIYKEAINNIAKHSQAKNATISIFTLSDQLKIEVSDDGVGFDTTADSNGNGLHNFKSRSDGENMIVDIASVVGQGTSIKIVLLYFPDQNVTG